MRAKEYDHAKSHLAPFQLGKCEVASATTPVLKGSTSSSSTSEVFPQNRQQKFSKFAKLIVFWFLVPCPKILSTLYCVHGLPQLCETENSIDLNTATDKKLWPCCQCGRRYVSSTEEPRTKTVAAIQLRHQSKVFALCPAVRSHSHSSLVRKSVLWHLIAHTCR
jgi:hypothetical protein